MESQLTEVLLGAGADIFVRGRTGAGSSGRAQRRWRYIFLGVMLLMILSRMTWMQLREYPVHVGSRALVTQELLTEGEGDFWQLWLAVPGLAFVGFANDDLPVERLVRFNMWLLLATVFSLVIAVRFMSSSWTVAVLTGAVLMSRGALLARLGELSQQSFIVALLAFWLTCACHFLRTGFWISLGSLVAVCGLTSLFDRVGLVLALPLPIMVWVGYRFRGQVLAPMLLRWRGSRLDSMSSVRIARLWGYVRRSMGALAKDEGAASEVPFSRMYERGALFRTLHVPFLLWVVRRFRWRRLFYGWVLVVFGLFALRVAVDAILALALAVDMGFEVGSVAALDQNWWRVLLQPLDIHYLASIAVVVLCAVQSPADGLISFFEVVWLVVGLFAVLLAGCLLISMVDVSILAQAGIGPELLGGDRPILVWMEPIFICMGVVGSYHLLQVSAGK